MGIFNIFKLYSGINILVRVTESIGNIACHKRIVPWGLST